jgi:hypothetical protein
MFNGCINLLNTPELNAKVLYLGSYDDMFCECSNINFIKMLGEKVENDFLNEGISAALRDWVKGVSLNGTFMKSRNATWDTTPGALDNSGVPAGWVVIDDTFPVNEDGLPANKTYSYPLYLHLPKEPTYIDGLDVYHEVINDMTIELESALRSSSDISAFLKDNPIFINGTRVESVSFSNYMITLNPNPAGFSDLSLINNGTLTGYK